MSVFVLNEKQQEKLSKMTVEKIVGNEKVTNELLNTWKIIQGEEAEETFQFEYDELFDEFDEVCPITLIELRETAPEIYNRIGSTKGNKIFNGIKSGKFTVGLTKKENVDAKIKSIQENPRINDAVKEKQIAKRKTMYEEGKKLHDKGVTLTKNMAWKIWRIEERKRTLEFVNEENLEKNKAKVKFLGEKFMRDLKNAKYGEE